MLHIVFLDTEKLPYKFVEQIEAVAAKYGHLVSYLTTGAEDLVERCNQADVILVNKNQINDEHLKALPNLKYILVVATGYDNVDVAAAKRYNIKVSNIPAYGSQTVAQHAISLLLELTNRVGWLNQRLKGGKWSGFGHTHVELSGLTLGVFGFGNIAKFIIKIAMGLGMKVLVCGSRGSNASYSTDLPVKFVNREDIFKHSDVISLNCPLNEETREMINQNSLALMKPNCFLINTSRGGLINENDLYHALQTGQIQGAGLDVFNPEPIDPHNPLLSLDNCVVTPHNAAMSSAALKRWIEDIEECLLNYQAGKFINLV